MRLFKCLAVFSLACSPQVCWAWSPCIQGVICLTAAEALTTQERDGLLNLLMHHPQYEEMILPPTDSDPKYRDECIIVRAAT